MLLLPDIDYSGPVTWSPIILEEVGDAISKVVGRGNCNIAQNVNVSMCIHVTVNSMEKTWASV